MVYTNTHKTNPTLARGDQPVIELPAAELTLLGR
jgi:hypothetical protein